MDTVAVQPQNALRGECFYRPQVRDARYRRGDEQSQKHIDYHELKIVRQQADAALSMLMHGTI
jgi:hypothetical protein